MSILRIKNQETGEWENIPAIVGPQGPQGPQGEKGDTGPTGPQGPQGEKGDTPIKGVDYYTDTEKAEMLNDVIAALPVYTGEVL